MIMFHFSNLNESKFNMVIPYDMMVMPIMWIQFQGTHGFPFKRLKDWVLPGISPRWQCHRMGRRCVSGLTSHDRFGPPKCSYRREIPLNFNDSPKVGGILWLIWPDQWYTCRLCCNLLKPRSNKQTKKSLPKRNKDGIFFCWCFFSKHYCLFHFFAGDILCWMTMMYLMLPRSIHSFC